MHRTTCFCIVVGKVRADFETRGGPDPPPIPELTSGLAGARPGLAFPGLDAAAVPSVLRREAFSAPKSMYPGERQFEEGLPGGGGGGGAQTTPCKRLPIGPGSDPEVDGL